MSGALPREGGSAVVRHLAGGCSECQETTSELWETLVTGRKAPQGEPEEYDAAFDRAWDRALRIHRRMSRDRESALARHQDLLEQPPAQQKLRIHNDPRFQTLALCESLIAASQKTIFDDVAVACHLAEVAREVAEQLDEQLYGTAIVADARADAWAHYANAVREASDFQAAEEALRRAYRYLEQGTGDPIKRAAYLRSLANLLNERGHIEESLAVLGQLEAIFIKLGDRHMLGRVQLKKAFAFFKKREPESAIPLLIRALEMLDPDRDPRRHVIALHNLTDALVQAGRTDEAKRHFDLLRRLHTEQGDRLNLLRFRWLEGTLAAAQGEVDTAERIFSEVRRSFIDLEIGIDVALVSLDLAEVLWQRGKRDESRRRLLEAIPILEALHVHAEALAAVAFLERSLRVEATSIELIRQTAAFVRRVQSEPTIRFRPEELARD